MTLLGTNTVETSSASGTVTVGSAVSAGNVVIVCVVWDGTGIPSSIAASDPRGNTYTVDASRGAANVTVACAIIRGTITTALQVGDVITVTIGAARTRWMLQADSDTGFDASPLDKTTGQDNPGSSASLSTGTTAATTQADERLYAVYGFGRGSGQNITGVGGWSSTAQVNIASGTTPRGMQVAYTTVAATGTQQGTATLSAAASYVSAIVTYKLASVAVDKPVSDSATVSESALLSVGAAPAEAATVSESAAVAAAVPVTEAAAVGEGVAVVDATPGDPAQMPIPDLRTEISWVSRTRKVWIDVSEYVELGPSGASIAIGRRRSNELEDVSPGTFSLLVDNDGGPFTPGNTSSPFHPYVKLNRPIRQLAYWPAGATNLLTRQQASGGQDAAATDGWYVPSGTLSAVSATATATAFGTTTPAATTVKVADADAANFEVGDVCRLKTSGGALKEITYFAITGKASSAGTTTITLAGGAQDVTAPGDVLVRYRLQWATGVQPTTGARITTAAMTSPADPSEAGEATFPVRAGLSYTFSLWASRGGTAVSVSPRVLWYDLTGALISETTGATTALTTALQRLTVSAAAPAGARVARVAVANETVLPGSPAIGYRAGTTAKSQFGTSLPLTIPATVVAGDGLLMWVTLADSARTVTTPSGWTYVADRTDGDARTYLFKAAATGSGATTSAGKTFSVSLTGTAGKCGLIFEAWSGTDPADHVHQVQHAGESSTSASHTTPNVTTTVPNCWIVSGCFDRSTTTHTWGVPGGDTKRHDVYTTGGGAATGVVSDNGAPVAAGTYGSKVFTSNIDSANATMWTVALKPDPASGASGATIQTTGWQAEQAAAASDWSAPATEYVRFTGFIDDYIPAWEGGVRPLCSIPATDAQKVFSRAKVRAALIEETLATGPVAYYMLGETTGATAAGNAAGTSQPALTIQTRGTVTDDMLSFGSGTGPGVDGQPALVLTPTSPTIGKALRGALTTPLGGDGIVGMSVAVCFLSSTGSGPRTIAGADDGYPSDGGAAAIFDIFANPTTPHVSAHLKLADVDDTAVSSLQWFDGHTHQAVMTAELSGGGYTVRLYIDGVLRDTATGATTATDFPQFTRFNVGCGALDTIHNLWDGTLSHAAGWNRALSLAEVEDLWTAASTAFSGDLSGARFERICDWAGFSPVDADPGQLTLGYHRADERPALQALSEVNRSEGGIWYIARDGALTFRDKDHRQATATPAVTLSADQIGRDVTAPTGDEVLRNDLTGVGSSGAQQRRLDADSITDYDQHDDTVETILLDDDDVLQRLAYMLGRYAQPQPRFADIPIEARSLALADPDLWADLLALEIGDLIRITDLPDSAPASTIDLWVEGMGEEITADGWTIRIDPSPTDPPAMVLDDPVRGVLDSNYLGY